MKILVLGGNGFLGSHLVDSLVASGLEVRVYDRSPEQFRDPLPKVEYVIGNFNDQSLLAEALVGIDVVVHLISTTVPSTSNMDPIADIEGNLINTVRLLKLIELQGVKKIVYLSSGGTVYGVPEISPIPESHTLKPISSYGIVKVAIENYIYMAHQSSGLEYSILRASNPYGPRQGHGGVQGVISTFLFNIFNDKTIQIWGDGKVVRDFIYIEDVVELITKAILSDIQGCFNVGFGQGISLLEILETIKQNVQPNFKIEFQDKRLFDVPHVVLNTNAVCKAFDWQPSTDIASGIVKTWDWIKMGAVSD